MLDANGILRAVHAERDTLRRFGVRRLGLFGSAARGQATADSDLDFLVELNHKSFDSYMAVKELLERMFQRKIDLVLASAVKPQLRERVLSETIYAEGL